eukprot:TRINITY_DN5889_c0_g1_i1.p1 TRINITY_DN5889_c0_g1~~TRINITY_DN5889_c0_g1_i1.p1  ORF type:complete len:987 (-),score=194.72 TRINITY_DN5889_c0_g1_i1:49-2625(-)
MGRWRWSGRLPAGTVGEYAFQCCWQRPSPLPPIFENLRVEVRNVEATSFVIFRRESSHLAVFQLINLSSEALLFCQEAKAAAEADEDSDGPQSQGPTSGERTSWLESLAERLSSAGSAPGSGPRGRVSTSLGSSSSTSPPTALTDTTRTSPPTALTDTAPCAEYSFGPGTLELPPGESAPFAWREPSWTQKRLEIRSPHSPRLVVRLALEKTAASKLLAVGARGHQLYYDIRSRGPSLVLTVSDMPRRQPPRIRSPQEQPELKVSVKLAGIGLSVVAPAGRAAAHEAAGMSAAGTALSPGGKANTSLTPSSSARRDPTTRPSFMGLPGAMGPGAPLRAELLFLSADTLTVAYRQSEAQEHLEASVQEVQLDNQREDALHPVLLSRGTSGDVKVPDQPFIRLAVSRRRPPVPELLHFDRLELQVRSIELRIDAGFILDLVDVARTLLPSRNSEPPAPEQDRDPLGADIEKEGTKLHIERLLIFKASVGLSFSGVSGIRWLGAQPGDVSFWYRLMASLSSLDSSQLRLDGFRLTDTTLDSTSLQAALKGHYYNQCLQELAWAVGSLEVLGNPRGFLRHVSRGCVDACCEPYYGAMLSPEDMLEGLVRGTSSCVKNAFFGTFNSLSKATGAASQSFQICLNEDRPRTAHQQPRDPGQGLRMGVNSLYQAISHGTGELCERPARGHQAGGLRGLVWGTGRGVLGCLAGPVVGCCDLTRSVAEGVRNTAMASDEQRRRLPRMLYGAERIMRPYSRADAQLKALLVAQNPRLSSLALVRCVRSPEGTVSAVCEDLFLHVSRGRLTMVPLRDIAEIEIETMQSRQVLILHTAPGSDRRPVLLQDADEAALRATAQMLGATIADRL